MKLCARDCALYCSRSPVGKCVARLFGRYRDRKVHGDLSISRHRHAEFNGLEATRQIIKDDPRAKVLILPLHDSDQVVREVLNAGARGFLLKSDAARDLVVAVEALRRDKTYFTSKVAAMVLEGYLKGHVIPSQVSVGRDHLTQHRARSCATSCRRPKHKEEVSCLTLD